MVLLNKIKNIKLFQKNKNLCPEIYYFCNIKDLISFMLSETPNQQAKKKEEMLKYFGKIKNMKLKQKREYFKYKQNNIY